MARCPKCGAKITFLYRFTQRESKQKTVLNKDEDLVCTEIDQYLVDGRDDFECPECQENIAWDEIEAKRVLKGGRK